MEVALLPEYDLLCVGDIVTDLTFHLPHLPTAQTTGISAYSLTVGGGGSTANTAVAAARMGLRVAFCGVVGTDILSKELIEPLKREWVDVFPIWHKGQGVVSREYSAKSC